MSEPVNIGAKVRLAGRGLDRIGEVKKIARGLSSDGKGEVQNCHVAFPELKVKGRKPVKACVEIHEGAALEVVG